MIVLIKQMKAKEGMEKEMEECLSASITSVENDPDSPVTEYRLFREEDDPQLFCVLLRFDDLAGMEAHKVKDYIKASAPTMIKCVESHSGFLEVGAKFE